MLLSCRYRRVRRRENGKTPAAPHEFPQHECTLLISTSMPHAGRAAVLRSVAPYLSGTMRQLNRLYDRRVIVLRLVDAGRDRPHPHRASRERAHQVAGIRLVTEPSPVTPCVAAGLDLTTLAQEGRAVFQQRVARTWPTMPRALPDHQRHRVRHRPPMPQRLKDQSRRLNGAPMWHHDASAWRWRLYPM